MVQSMDHVTVAREQAPPPPLVVMSLSIKSILNPKTHSNEVGEGVCVGGGGDGYMCALCMQRRPIIHTCSQQVIATSLSVGNSLECSAFGLWCGMVYLEWQQFMVADSHVEPVNTTT